MEKDTIIKVTNRDSGTVGYNVYEMGIRRQYAPQETKEVTFGELQALSYLPGGKKMLMNYLVIENPRAIHELLGEVEPEYYYTEKEVKRILLEGTQDEFLDCLDFAPKGVLELIKDLAVSLPVNDVAKRDAILEKLNFNVSRAIEIKNTKLDGETEESTPEKKTRRVAVETETKDTGRRTATPKYNIVSVKE